MKNKKHSRYSVRLLSAIISLAILLSAGCAVSPQAQSGSEQASQVDGQETKEQGGSTEDGQETKEQDGSTEEGQLVVHFIDVGQGDATLLQSEGHAMLIDAGDNDKGTLVQNYLTKRGVTELDYVIGTHPDADHIGGMDVVLYKFDCDNIFLPEVENGTKTYREVADVLKSKKYKATCPEVGSTYKLGAASFTVVAPNRDYGDDTNNWSISVLVENGTNRFLFTGDAEEPAEEDMLQNGISLSADVLKVAHHGSSTATSEDFLAAVDPKWAVISAGEENSYGHPHAEVLNRLRSHKVKVFRTDEQGTVVASSDGSKITWNCSPDESWKAGEPTGGKSGSHAKDGTATEKDGAATEKDGTATEKQLQGRENEDKAYVLNTNTKKFHLPSCGSVQQIKDENKKRVDESREELIQEGYAPCKKCNP